MSFFNKLSNASEENEKVGFFLVAAIRKRRESFDLLSYTPNVYSTRKLEWIWSSCFFSHKMRKIHLFINIISPIFHSFLQLISSIHRQSPSTHMYSVQQYNGYVYTWIFISGFYYDARQGEGDWNYALTHGLEVPRVKSSLFRLRLEHSLRYPKNKQTIARNLIWKWVDGYKSEAGVGGTIANVFLLMPRSCQRKEEV